MKVLLFEQWYGGHFTNYLNALVPELSRVSGKLIIALSDKTKYPGEMLERRSSHHNVEFARPLPTVSPGLSLADRYASARNLLECLGEVRPDFTIIPSADAQASGMALVDTLGFDVRKRFGPIEGTLHYGYGEAATRPKERVKEYLYSQTYKRLPFASVNFVNFTYYEYAIKRDMFASGRARFVGDPVPQPRAIGREAARKLLGIEPDGRYLGLLGSLDRRKAVPQLLAAFRLARLAPKDRLLLAGRLDPAYASLIQKEYSDLVRQGRLIVMDRFLSESELANGYEALDVATVVYGRFPGLASLALKAVAAGTPVIAHDFGWLGAAVRRFGIGELTDVFDPAVFAVSLASALNRERLDVSKPPLKRLMQFHTEANFVAQMTRGVKRAAGLPLEPVLDWDWVLETDSAGPTA